jgi:hypothetical protein
MLSVHHDLLINLSDTIFSPFNIMFVWLMYEENYFVSRSYNGDDEKRGYTASYRSLDELDEACRNIARYRSEER